MPAVTGRDYQERFARRELPRLWKAGARAVLGVAPVGAGKTRMTAMVAEDRFARGAADFWHLAHRRELIEQPWNLLRSYGLPATRVLAGESPDPSSPLHVASADTIWNRRIVPCRKTAVISVDEAHRVVGPRYTALIARFGEAYGPENVRLVLWTATPYRLDGRPLGDVADALTEIATPGELIDRGILMDPLVVGAEDPDLSGVGRRAGEWVKEAVAERVNTAKLVGNVVSEYARLSGGAPAVYFAVSVAHSLHVAERLRAAGVRAEHLDATTPKEKRSRVLAGLAIGGRGSTHPDAVDVVVNVDVLREGWDSESDYRRVLEDFPDMWLGRSFPPEYVPLEVLGDLDPTESCCAYQQRVGRVTRTHPRKLRAVVISHSGNWQRHPFLRDHHGFALDRPVTPGNASGTRSKAVAAGSGYSPRRCSSCLAAWPPGTILCDPGRGGCGADLSPPPADLPEETDDRLAPVSRETHAAPPPPDPALDRIVLRNLWARWLRGNARRKADGKPPAKAGQVAAIFRQQTGRWPPPEMSLAARRQAEEDLGKKEAR